MNAPLVQAFLPSAGALRASPTAVSQSPADAGLWLREMGFAQSQRQDRGLQQPRATLPYETAITREATAFLEGLADVRGSAAAVEPSAIALRAGDPSPALADVQLLEAKAAELPGGEPAALRDTTSGTSGVIPPPRDQWHRPASRTSDKPETAQPAIASMPQPAPPVRVHADWSADGVRIWLGMDAEGSRNAQVLAAHLQGWLASQGIRALSITCNGKTLYEHWGQPGEPVHPADPHKEQT